MEYHSDKLISLIRDSAAMYLKANAEVPPGTLLTVTRVELSSDEQRANVFISIFPTGRIGVFMEKFNQWQNEFNGYARKEMRLRFVPAIRFKLDEAELKSEKIERLLEEGK